MKQIVFTVLMYLAASVLAIWGQTVPVPVPGTPEEAARNRQLEMLRLRSTLGADYILGPGDLIEVDIIGVPEYTKAVQVNQDGTITLPYLEPVRVEGLTTIELSKKLTALLDGRLLENPQVSISIKEHRSQPVHLLGEVNRPGTYQLTHFMRLVDVLSLAGGFKDTAADSCVIHRLDAAGQAYRVEISLPKLLEDGDADQNVPLQAGDIIQVPKRVERFYYILGDVGRPGTYPLPEDRDLSVSEAVSNAGGFLKTAALSQTRVIRAQPDGTRQITQVDLGKILKGEEADQPVRENDLFYIPDSKTKNVAYAFLNSMPSFLVTGLWTIF